MRADLIRIYKSVHTWAGILSGMALFIAFYAGALTVFKEPLTRWASPPQSRQTVPLELAQDLILRTLEAHPEVAKEFTLHLHDDESVTTRVSWQRRATPDADDHDASAQLHFGAHLDAQGQLQTSQTQASELATFIDVLHRVVGLPFDNDPNRLVMGGVAVLYTVALVSGLIVLLPSLVKDLFALRVGKNLKRMWLDAHNVVGLFSLPFHLVMGLTAVVFAFHDPIYDVQNLLLHQGQWGRAFQRGAEPAKPAVVRDLRALLPPQALVDRAGALSPNFRPYSIQYQQLDGARATARVWGHDDTAVSPRARGGFVALDPYSGKVLSTDYLPGAQNLPNLVISSLFALHMASFGGSLAQWLYFLLGLAGAWLFYSGNLLWIETRRRRAVPHRAGPVAQRLDCRLMACATVGVCLGCVCGISALMLSQKCLHGHVADLAGWGRWVYYSSFFGALAWALWRGAARAAVHLLWLGAALTLAIPLTSLAGAWWPTLGPWGSASVAALGVDLTALAGAAGLGWMARVTARRMARGGGDSVWSSERGGLQGH